MDVVKYMFRYIPQWITVKKKEYYFCLFINHAHWDFRFCYKAHDDSFVFLVENIDSQKDLLKQLKWLRSELKKQNLLGEDYDTPEGWTKKKLAEWQSKQ